MPEWLMKIFSHVISVKTALVVLLTIALTIFFGKFGADFVEKYSFSQVPSQYLLALACYCVAFIIISASYVSAAKLRNLYIITRNYIANRLDFSKKTSELLPHLTKIQIRLLTEIIVNGKALLDNNEQTECLLKHGLIYKSQSISKKKSIYNTNKQVKRIFLKFIKNEQTKHLNNISRDRNSSALTFLSLFYNSEISFGTSESNQLMPYDIYSSAISLTDQHLIIRKPSSEYRDKPNIEQFELDNHAEQFLSKYIFHKRPMRKVLELNLNYVSGVVSTGGGAIGSRYRF